MAGKIQVGILALQGAVTPHLTPLAALGVEPVMVRRPEHLTSLDAIILPGGESTAMIHLLRLNELWDPLLDFVHRKPSWGICAGAILLAKQVTQPEQASLGLVDITIARNAFGRQIDSFEAPLSPTALWKGGDFEGVFIRAPRITRVGQGVDTLFNYADEPVMVEQGDTLLSTFHPELTPNFAIHQYFLEKTGKRIDEAPHGRSFSKVPSLPSSQT